VVFVFIFPYFFVSVPCAKLSWPSHQLLSGRKSTISYRIVLNDFLLLQCVFVNSSNFFSGLTPKEAGNGLEIVSRFARVKSLHVKLRVCPPASVRRSGCCFYNDKYVNFALDDP